MAGALLTAGAAWGAARLAANTLGTETLPEQTVQVAAGVLAGLIIFLGAALLFRMEEFELLKRSVLRLRR